MTDQTTADTTDGEAFDKAIEAWNSQTSWDYSSDGLDAACWAFHERMTAWRNEVASNMSYHGRATHWQPLPNAPEAVKEISNAD